MTPLWLYPVLKGMHAVYQKSTPFGWPSMQGSFKTAADLITREK